MNTRLVYSHHISFFRVFLLTLHVDARVSQAGYIPVPGIIGINLGDTTLCRRRKRSVLAARWKVCCMEPLQPLLPGLFLLFLLLLLLLLLLILLLILILSPFSRLPYRWAGPTCHFALIGHFGRHKLSNDRKFSKPWRRVAQVSCSTNLEFNMIKDEGLQANIALQTKVGMTPWFH